MGGFILIFIAIGLIAYIESKAQPDEFSEASDKVSEESLSNVFETFKQGIYVGGVEDVYDITPAQVYLSVKNWEGHLSIYFHKIKYEKCSIPKIPFAKIKSIKINTETQIKENVTLTRVLCLGIFALGAKKQTEYNEKYLIIKYFDDELNEDNEIVVKGNEMVNIAKKYRQIKKLMKEKEEQHISVTQE